MGKTNEVTEQKQTTKEHVISDQLNADVTYRWSQNINRKTENNNALIKCPPVFLNAVQEKNAELTSDRKIKQYVCQQLDIAWKEEFMNFSLIALTEKREEKAVADKTDVEKQNNIITRFREKLESAIKETGKKIPKAKILSAIDKSKNTDADKELLKTTFIDGYKTEEEFSFE